MKNEQFTPGPWRTEPNRDKELIDVFAHPNKFICKVNGRDLKLTDEANANLIAAAPDMYEALKEMVAYLEQFTSHSDMPSAMRAKAALSTANPQSVTIK